MIIIRNKVIYLNLFSKLVYLLLGQHLATDAALESLAGIRFLGRLHCCGASAFSMHTGHVILKIVSPGKLGQALSALEDALIRVIAQMSTQRMLAEALGTQWTLEQLVLADGGGAARVKETMIEQI